jgi:hypothetical protein
LRYQQRQPALAERVAGIDRIPPGAQRRVGGIGTGQGTQQRRLAGSTRPEQTNTPWDGSSSVISLKMIRSPKATPKLRNDNTGSVVRGPIPIIG